jgi:hypothetical protein
MVVVLVDFCSIVCSHLSAGCILKKERGAKIYYWSRKMLGMLFVCVMATLSLTDECPFADIISCVTACEHRW